MAEPFKPRGPRPEWRIVYDELLLVADYGQVITYPALSAVLGRDFVDNRSPIYRARQELGRMRHRWLEAVPKIGYRVIEANEHVRVAGNHKSRARRQFGKMIVVAQATDLSRLTSDELDFFDRQNRINNTLVTIVTSHEQRLNRIEEALRADGKL